MRLSVSAGTIDAAQITGSNLTNKYDRAHFVGSVHPLGKSAASAVLMAQFNLKF